MTKKNICTNCAINFERQYAARFCSRSCWYKWNAKKLASFNELRFQWKTATEEEKQKKIKENYEKHVIRKDGCWEWSGVKDKDGYGQIACGYHKQTKAHRVSWNIYKGTIPEGMIVCHHCDNPPCTNPSCLFLGTKKTNALDMSSKLRGTNGTKNKHAKLQENDIPEIRRRLNQGESFYEIAKEFTVKPTTIWNIRENKSWKHVEENKCERIERKTTLTKDDIPKIRKLLEMGVKQVKIAKDFGVSDMTISKIKNGETWKHVI